MPTQKKTAPAAAAPKKKRASRRAKSTERQLFAVTVPASTPSGELRRGQLAEEGAPILKTHGHLFQPIAIDFKA